MKFGIAARQENRVGGGIGRLAGERREGQDFGAGFPPVVQKVRIGKRESLITGHGVGSSPGAAVETHPNWGSGWQQV